MKHTIPAQKFYLIVDELAELIALRSEPVKVTTEQFEAVMSLVAELRADGPIHDSLRPFLDATSGMEVAS